MRTVTTAILAAILAFAALTATTSTAEAGILADLGEDCTWKACDLRLVCHPQYHVCMPGSVGPIHRWRR